MIFRDSALQLLHDVGEIQVQHRDGAVFTGDVAPADVFLLADVLDFSQGVEIGGLALLPQPCPAWKFRWKISLVISMKVSMYLGCTSSLR